MSNMNKLLGDIVEASGGVVTNAGNRNGLLKDWLDAVGQVCEPLWQPNGVNQQLSINIPIVPGDTISFNLIVSATTSSRDSIFDTADRVRVRLESAGVWDFAGGSLTVDGANVNDGDNLPPLGSVVNCTFTSTSTTTLLYIGSFNGLGVFSAQPVYNLSINDGSIYNYPLDDGFVNNPVARNLGSGTDGTFINNDSGAWGERCE